MNKSGRALVTSVIDGAAMSSGHTFPPTTPAHSAAWCP